MIRIFALLGSFIGLSFATGANAEYDSLEEYCENTHQAIFDIEASIAPISNFILFYISENSRRDNPLLVSPTLKSETLEISSQFDTSFSLLSDICRAHYDEIPTRPVHEIRAILLKSCQSQLASMKPSLIEPAGRLSMFTTLVTGRFYPTIGPMAETIQIRMTDVINLYDENYSTAYRLCRLD